MREKYINKYNFLNDKFDTSDILIYSSNKERTIISAAAKMAGLYPDSSKLETKSIHTNMPPAMLSNKD